MFNAKIQVGKGISENDLTYINKLCITQGVIAAGSGQGVDTSDHEGWIMVYERARASQPLAADILNVFKSSANKFEPARGALAGPG